MCLYDDYLYCFYTCFTFNMFPIYVYAQTSVVFSLDLSVTNVLHVINLLVNSSLLIALCVHDQILL